jgi:hypothetical protein
MREASGFLVLLGLWGCGAQAERMAAEARAAAERASAEHAQVAAELASLQAEHEAAEVETLLLLELQAAIARQELGAERASTPEEIAFCAQRIQRLIEQSTPVVGTSVHAQRLLLQGRAKAAEMLARAGPPFDETAREAAQTALAAAQEAHAANPEERALSAMLGDAFLGVGRVERARGDLAAAVPAYVRGIELLLAADKGRGDGTGTGENRGKSTGGGDGRKRGKGKNREQSVFLKAYLCSVYAELQAIYREQADSAKELTTLGEERLVQGNICQVRNGDPNAGYQFARLGMSELIDRLGDATEVAGDPADAVKVEKLSLQIVREVSEERPDIRLFKERIVWQEIEIASRAAALGNLEELRATVTQAFEDMKVLSNVGLPAPTLLYQDVRLSLEMARGLGVVAAARGDAGQALRAEAANWYGRAIEGLDGLRVEGVLPAAYAKLEEDALLGIERLQVGG